MRGGLALQVVSGGVAWLVDRQLRAGRQLYRGEQPPALVADRVGDGHAPGDKVRQRLLEVIAHQVELVLPQPLGWMYCDLGGRQLEDQPAIAGADACKSEHVTDEDPISLRIGAVENDVCSVDHVSLSLSWLLFDNAEPQIGSRGGLEYPRSFQFYLLIDERLEKAKTFPKENRDDANVDFVNQPGS